MYLPPVRGRNLDREIRSYPADFEQALNLLFIAFQRWQQASIDSWLSCAETLEQSRDDLAYYEFPTIQSTNLILRTFINEGMRAGIPDPKARDRTVTLYLDKPALRKALDMPDEDQIYVLLASKTGEVLWRDRGKHSPEKEASLMAAIKEAGG
ncbi:MAG: hypothetical protein PVF85_01860 [Anaerolineales bacterium]|jgi:hypothetical protein